MPLMVHSICRRPRDAASAFATASPVGVAIRAKAVIPCAAPRYSRTFSETSLRTLPAAAYPNPTRVRQVQDRAPASTATRHTGKETDIVLFPHLQRKLPLRPTFCRRNESSSRLLEALAPGVIFSFKRSCRSEVARKCGSRGRALFSAPSIAGLHLFSLARASAACHSPNFLRHFLTASRSPPHAIGIPAGITSTFSAAICRAYGLLRCVHREARRLFAIPERCVKDAYDVPLSPPHAQLRNGQALSVNLSFILLLIIMSYTAWERVGPLGHRELQVFLMVAREGNLFPRGERLYRTPAGHQPGPYEARGLPGHPSPFVRRAARPASLMPSLVLKDYDSALLIEPLRMR